MAKKEKIYPLAEIGGRIQHARLDKGLDRLDFYNKVYGLKPGEGIKPDSKIRTVNNWESSTHLPDIEDLSKICKALDVSADYILLPDQTRNHDIEFIHEYTHLSEQAILNILYEGSDTGKNSEEGQPNNQRVFMLDWLLSNRETFSAFMDELWKLLFPGSYYITPNVWKKTGWLNVYEDDSVEVDPSFLRFVSDSNPDNIYQRIRSLLDTFILNMKTKDLRYIAPNEFDPPEIDNLENDLERLEDLRQRVLEDMKNENNKKKNGGKKQ